MLLDVCGIRYRIFQILYYPLSFSILSLFSSFSVSHSLSVTTISIMLNFSRARHTNNVNNVCLRFVREFQISIIYCYFFSRFSLYFRCLRQLLKSLSFVSKIRFNTENSTLVLNVYREKYLLHYYCNLLSLLLYIFLVKLIYTATHYTCFKCIVTVVQISPVEYIYFKFVL